MNISFLSTLPYDIQVFKFKNSSGSGDFKYFHDIIILVL